MINIQEMKQRGIVTVTVDNENVQRPVCWVYLQLDTPDDLDDLVPSSANYPFPTMLIVAGSELHIISTNEMYMVNSSGVWVIQDEASRMNVYTKPEIDSMFEDYTTTADQNLIDAAQDADIDNLQAADTIHLNALKWIVDTGNVKNLCPESSATATANYTIDMDLPAGSYVVQFGSLTSTDTDYATCQVIALYGATVVSTSPQLQMERGTNVHGTLNVGSAANKLQIYASRTGPAATGDTLTFSDLMVCVPELYAISTKYVPYAQTNLELTP